MLFARACNRHGKTPVATLHGRSPCALCRYRISVTILSPLIYIGVKSHSTRTMSEYFVSGHLLRSRSISAAAQAVASSSLSQHVEEFDSHVPKSSVHLKFKSYNIVVRCLKSFTLFVVLSLWCERRGARENRQQMGKTIPLPTILAPPLLTSGHKKSGKTIPANCVRVPMITFAGLQYNRGPTFRFVQQATKEPLNRQRLFSQVAFVHSFARRRTGCKR